ncbi:MAG TPA: autotransporter-associated beta strand repeat-containing protein [Tepidisphaeraceae bacterium]
MRNLSKKSGLFLAMAASATILATHQVWGDTFGSNGNSPLNSAANWIDETNPATDTAPPGANDLAQFDNNDTGSADLTLGGNMSWLGLVVTNPTNPVIIDDDGSTLTLGASGINMNAATQNLTMNQAIALSANETWNVGSGRTLTVNNVDDGGFILSFSGAGTTAVNGNMGGVGGITVNAAGSLTLNGANTYTGSTTVSRGTLTIGATGTLASTQLNLGGGIFALAAGQAGANFSSTNLTAGTSTISTSTLAGTLNLGTITHALGAGVNIILPTSGTITTSNANSVGPLLAPWAVVNGTDWATVSGGTIAAVSSYANDTWSSNAPTTITTNDSISNGTTNSLRFGSASADTVTLSGTNTIISGGILVSSGVGNNLSVINGGTLEGPAAGEMVIDQYNTANSLVIGSTIADNGGQSFLSKVGPGLVILTGTNTFTGQLTVGSGSLQLGNGGTTGSVAGLISVNTGANLSIDRSDSFTLGNNISGAGSFTQAGSGTVTFNVPQSYTGSTNVNNGTLFLDFNGGGGTPTNILNTGSPLNMGGGTLTVNGNATSAVTQTVNGLSPVSGASTINVVSNGAGTLLNLGAITLGTGTAETGPTVQFNPGSGQINTTTGTASALMTGGAGNNAYATVGTTDWAAKDPTNTFIVGASTITGFYTVTNGATSGSGTGVSSTVSNEDFQGATGSAAGSLAMFRMASGSETFPTMRFNTANTFVVQVKSTTVMAIGGILVTPNVANNNVTFNNDGSSSTNINTVNLGENSSAGGAEFPVFQYNTQGEVIFDTAIRNRATNSLVKSGAGTLVLAAQNQQTGPTFINGGTILVSPATVGGVLNVADAGFGAAASAAAVDLNGGGVVIDATATMDNAGANPRPFVVGTPGGYIGATATHTVTIDGLISGSGPLGFGVPASSANNNTAGLIPGTGAGTANATAVNAAGTVVINNTANTFIGQSTIYSGTLRVDNTSGLALGSGNLTVNSNATLAGVGTLGAMTTIASGGHLDPGDNGVGTLNVGSLTLNSGSISDFEISNTNVHDQVDVSGMLTLSGTDSINLYQPGGTNPFFASGTYNLFQIGSGGLTGSASDFSVADAQPNTNYAFGTNGSFLTVTISSAAVNSSWAVDASGNWNDSSNWSAGVPTNALDIANFPTNILSTARTVTLTDNRTVGTMNFGTTGLNNPFPYTIAAGGGTLTLDNGTSAALINAGGGTFYLAAPVALTSHGVSITASNDPIVGVNSTMMISGSISGAGPVMITGGTGTVILSGNNSYTTTSVAVGGTLQLGSNGTTGTFGTGAVTDDGSIVFALQGPVAISNNISSDNLIPTGSGSITQGGSGVLTLSGNNSYTGPTNVNGGTLQLGSATAIGTASVLTVNSGATLDLNGNAASVGSLNGSGTIDNTSATAASLTTGSLNDSPIFSGVIQNSGSGALSIVKNGTGLLTLTNPSTYSGGTTINSGEIKATTSGALGTGTITVNSNFGLQLGDGVTLSNNIIVGNVGSNPFVDVPDDGATATLSGNITMAASNTQYRLGATGGATDTPATIIMTGTSTIGTNFTIFTLGNIIFAGNSSLTANSTGGAFFIGRNSSTSTLNLTIQDNSVVTGTTGLSLGGNGSASDDAATQVNITGNGVLSAGTGTMNLNSSTVNGGAVYVLVSGNGTLEAGAFADSTGSATVDFNGGSIVATANDPAGGAFFPNVGGNVTINSGGLTINDGGFSVTVNEQLNSSASPDGGLTKIGSGTVTLGNSETYNGATIISAGTLALAANQNSTSGFTIDTGATLKLTPHGPWIDTGIVNFNGGALDVTTNTVNFDTTVAGHSAATILADLTTGYASGSWNGPGINSSSAAADRYTTLGYSDSGNTFTIMYTWYGDLNLNGVVDSDDVTAMTNGNGTSWSQGDLNFDGKKNADDWALFMLGASMGGNNNISTITPEPGALSLLVLGATGMLARRRRQH